MSDSPTGVNADELDEARFSQADLATMLALLAAATELTDEVDRVLRSGGTGLTAKEWDVLAATHALGPCRPSGLLRRLALTRRPQTLSSILDRLESRGLVTRSPLERGGRGVLVATTDEGSAVVQRLFPLLSRRVVGPFASHYNSAELSALGHLLERIDGRADPAERKSEQ
jgi:DNA-binding MarR family transcriptional regulator